MESKEMSTSSARNGEKTQMQPHYYNVDISWNTDRKGVMCSPELSHGLQCVEIATPPEFPKGIAGIWSPEHLFTAAVSSCLMTTFLAVAENSKLNFISFRCGSKGKLEQVDGKYYMTEVELTPKLVIRSADDMDRAMKVLQKSEANCLISNSIKARVTMIPSIEVQAIAA